MMSKIKVIRVELTRAEGPSDLCGTKFFNSLAEADAQLRENALTAPEGGGYDKHDFTLTFEDGETYEGRIDVVHPNNKRGTKNETIGEHVRDFLRFSSGLYTKDELPKHFKTLSSYLEFVNTSNSEKERIEMVKFLDTYELTSTT